MKEVQYIYANHSKSHNLHWYLVQMKIWTNDTFAFGYLFCFDDACVFIRFSKSFLTIYFVFIVLTGDL